MSEQDLGTSRPSLTFPRAGSWLAGESLPNATRRLTVIGAPIKLGALTAGRCDLAPAAIRKTLQRFSTYDTVAARDLRHLRAKDAGDLDLAALSPERAFEPVRAGVAANLQDSNAVVLLGGDGSLTLPGFHGMGAPLDRCGLVTFDAHHDLLDLEAGPNNSNIVRALLRDGLEGDHIFQIGLQRFSNDEASAAAARGAGIHVLTFDHVAEHGIVKAVHHALGHLHLHVEHIYVNFDLDVLDRIYAPAVAGARPGGLAPHQLRRAAHLCGTYPKVRALDLVGVDPTRDVAEVTVQTAAACLLEFASGVLARPTHA